MARIPSQLGAVAVTLAMAASTPLHASDRSGVVRNTSPQKAVELPAQTQPIYYPRLAHDKTPPGADSAHDALLRRFLDRHSGMDYDGAADVAARIVELEPDRPETHYNQACALARLYRIDAAIDALEKAVECGWRDPVHVSLDPDLDALRGNARYTKLVADLARREMELAAPQAGTDAVAVFHEGRLVGRWVARGSGKRGKTMVLDHATGACRRLIDGRVEPGPRAEPALLVLCSNEPLARTLARRLGRDAAVQVAAAKPAPTAAAAAASTQPPLERDGASRTVAARAAVRIHEK